VATWLLMTHDQLLPSGYLTVCHGKSPFLKGKPSISMGHVYHGKLLRVGEWVTRDQATKVLRIRRIRAGQ